jgi:hypothetical protein
MRLPQSISTRLPFLVLITILFASCPLPSRAATQQLQCSPTSLKFGELTLGQTETQLVVLTNTGHSSTKISAITVTGSEFRMTNESLPLVLPAGHSVSLQVTFAPKKIGWTGGRITFSSNASNPTLPLGLQGSGVSSEAVKASPASLSFGQVSVGSSSTLSVVLTNPRAWKIKLFAVQVVGTGFSVSGPTLPMTLNPKQSITLKVAYAPPVAGSDGGGVSIAGPGVVIPLTGTGAATTAGQLTLTPASVNFGSVDIGSNSKQIFTVKATGASVTISSASSSNSQFTLPGVSLPLTIASGQSEQLDAVFTPTKSGSTSGNLTFASNASNTPSTESLAGTGVSAQYSVNLSWNASTSSVQGYNVYRGTTSGKYSKLNSSLDANTAYSDNTVASGVTYYYAVTAVNSKGEESSYSSPLQVKIP